MNEAEPASLLVLISGGLLVGCIYIVGARFKRRVGIASAVIFASTPVFLHQVAQPTGELPAATLWMMAVAGITGTKPRGALLGAIAAAAAIIVRPTLMLLAVPLAVFLLLRPERLWRERVTAAATFAAVAGLGVGIVLLQTMGAGPSFAAGDPAGMEFSTEHIASNATGYAMWLSETLTPGWVLAAGAPFLLPGALTRLLLWMFLLNVASSLAWVAFPDWTYLRFLLPTMPLVIILGVAVIDSACRRTWSWTSRPVLFVVAIAMSVYGVRFYTR